jgi:lipopolysaccharide/colanic/teichoic acid biosynthesis glycosyltransferase
MLVDFGKHHNEQSGEAVVAYMGVKDATINAEPLEHPLALLIAKRTFDLAAVTAAAPFALLIVAVAALLILVTCGRPILFVQERVGYCGRVFKILKLRTMSNAPVSTPMATAEQDNRITALGRFLRLYRIDELPQLINVLKGEMSLIGPRPEQRPLVEKYRLLMPHYDDRHLVKPGITGLAQVMYGYAGDEEQTRIKLRYDLYYVSHMSFLMDVKIVVKTVWTVLGSKGAR